jgi:hypothetical protein
MGASLCIFQISFHFNSNPNLFATKIAAGGAQQCNPISVDAFSTLLAAPGPCKQQEAADKMIDLGRTLGNDAEMIRLAQIFAQQPRNTASQFQDHTIFLNNKPLPAHLSERAVLPRSTEEC